MSVTLLSTGWWWKGGRGGSVRRSGGLEREKGEGRRCQLARLISSWQRLRARQNKAMHHGKRAREEQDAAGSLERGRFVPAVCGSTRNGRAPRVALFPATAAERPPRPPGVPERRSVAREKDSAFTTATQRTWTATSCGGNVET